MKYNLSKIMKRAWELFNQLKSFLSNRTFGDCLKTAWAEAKKALSKPAEITLESIKTAAHGLVASGEYEAISYKEWNGHGRSRIYIKAIRHTLAGNVRVADCGYWDNNNSQYVAQAVDLLA